MLRQAAGVGVGGGWGDGGGLQVRDDLEEVCFHSGVLCVCIDGR